MPNTLLLIKHSGFREISEEEILKDLSKEELALPRKVIEVDTFQFKDEVAAGNWGTSEAYLIAKASEILQKADETSNPIMRYFSLAETPHILALGALMGDERAVQVRGQIRASGSWTWEEDNDIKIFTQGVPSERVPLSGHAVIRVELSASVQDVDISKVLGSEVLADVKIKLPEGVVPTIDSINSVKAAEKVREVFRSVLASIVEYRPGVEVIHLFIAASAPVCFLIGQELRLRSHCPFQTYKFLKQDDTPYDEAIFLTLRDAAEVLFSLTEENLKRASEVRMKIWPDALKSVQQYANVRKDTKSTIWSGLWFEKFLLSPRFKKIKPFASLPKFFTVIEQKDRVDITPFLGEYGHDKTSNLWKLNDDLLVGLSKAASDEDKKLEKLIRLFLFHEYLHDFNGLTKYNSTQVGRFPNALERIDYAADLYALFHELDFCSIYDQGKVDDDTKAKKYLVDTIDLMIRSMWAFEPHGSLNDWQVRRIRRYLNWYWRRVQVSRAKDLDMALFVLSKQPALELAGCQIRAFGRRVIMRLNKPDPSTDLSIGLVTEDERLLQLTNSVGMDINSLLDAFRNKDHQSIITFFEGVIDEAAQYGGALPNKLFY